MLVFALKLAFFCYLKMLTADELKMKIKQLKRFVSNLASAFRDLDSKTFNLKSKLFASLKTTLFERC
ncbi:MAG: hypothetical protein ACKESB_01725 [Candidatus Hodgkinia cicadicola]